MQMDNLIHYSMGQNKYDNKPLQLVSDDFEAFEKKILSTRSLQKGETFFTSGFANGRHSDIRKYPEESTYRLKKLALPRRFMPMDFDGFMSPTAYSDLISFLGIYRGFGYETWSHTTPSPRARAVLELSRPIIASESLHIGTALEHEINAAIGSRQIKFDRCVYQLEQPIYVAPKEASSFIFGGSVIDVDHVLSQRLSIPKLVSKAPRHLKPHILDEVTASLLGKMPPPDETPRQIARLKAMLNYISADCDYEVYRRVIWAILSTEWNCAEAMAYDWSQTAPNRFDQNTFDGLVSGFDSRLPNHPTVGSIKYLAEQGGWSE